MRHSTDGDGSSNRPTGEIYPLPAKLKTVTNGVATDVSGTNPLPTQGREGYTAVVEFDRPANTTGYDAGDAIGRDGGTSQVETATVAGTITVGTEQVETATVVGTITAPVQQVETATVVGTVTAGTAQVETATVVGTVSGTGTCTVVVTGADIAGSPLTFNVDVVATDTATAAAGKIRTVLDAVDAITDFWTVGGTNAAITLTGTAARANDATLNISIDNGTCTGLTAAPTSANTTAGVAPGTGNAKVVITGAGITGSPLTIPFAVAASDDASAVAGKARTAVGAVAAVTALYTVGGTGATVTLTRTTAAANDATLNIAIDNDTCTGLTAAPTSANTTAGVASGAGNAKVTVTSELLVTPEVITFAVAASDNASAVAGKARTAVGANANVAAHFTVSGATDAVILTAKVKAANDTTLNIAIANDTCTGLTAAPTSAHTTAGVAPGTGNVTVTITSAHLTGSPLAVPVAVAAGDNADAVAGKIRTALAANSTVAAVFTVSGATDKVILTKTVPAANDATLNIATTNGTSTGLTPAATSADTTAGSVTSTNAGSAVFELTNIGPAGGHVMITDAPDQIYVATRPAGMTAFKFHLFDEAPTAVVDNAAFAVQSADRGKYLGWIGGDVPEAVAGQLTANNTSRNKKVKLKDGSTSLWVVRTTDGGYTPTSSARKRTVFHTIAV